jgi:colanic acid biosynthesis glycosyl transferase WcaI
MSRSPRPMLLVLDFGAYQFSADFASEVADWADGAVHYRFPVPVPAPNSRSVSFRSQRVMARRVKLSRPFARYGLRRALSEVDLAVRLFGVVVRTRASQVISANMPILAQTAVAVGSKLSGSSFTFWLQDIFGIGGKLVLGADGGSMGHAARAIGTIERQLLRRADRVVAISPAFEQWLGEIGVPPDRVVVQANWADPHKVHPGLRRPRAEVFGDGGRVFLYAGTIGLKHDTSLLQTLALALQSEGHRLVVVSEGFGADELAAHGVATVLPFQPADTHGTILASADALVVTIREEAGLFSVPSKVNAYLCAGRPILAAVPDTNLVAEMLRTVGCPTISPNDSAEFAARAVALARCDNNELDAIGATCRAYAVEHFAIDSIARIVMGTRPATRTRTNASLERS